MLSVEFIFSRLELASHVSNYVVRAFLIRFHHLVQLSFPCTLLLLLPLAIVGLLESQDQSLLKRLLLSLKNEVLLLDRSIIGNATSLLLSFLSFFTFLLASHISMS